MSRQDANRPAGSASPAEPVATNEAAERLNAERRSAIDKYGERAVDEIGSIERRATVERIREAANRRLVDGDAAIGLTDFDAILDEEAVR